MVVAGETAGVGGARIGDGSRSVRPDDIDVKIHEPFARNGCAGAAHAVSGVACGAGKAIIDVPRMFAEACICHDLIQVVTLSAKRIRTIDAEIRIGEEVVDQLARRRRLAEFIAALKNVRPLRAMRTIRSQAAKFAIVIAVVAIGAENLRPHAAPLCNSVEIEHVAQQARLRQRAAPHVSHRMAGGASERELGNNIQEVARRNCTSR